MMSLKVLVLLIALLGAHAQTGGGPIPLFSWTGSHTGANTFYPPNTSGGCTVAQTTLNPYKIYNATFATSGVRQVVLTANFNTVVIYLYNGPFTSSNGCTNYVATLTNANQPQDPGALNIDDSFNFVAGVTYSFVVTSTATSGGIFGLQVIPSNVVGTTSGGLSWTPVNKNNGTCAPYAFTPATQTFSSFQFTLPATDSYDLYIIFEAGATAYPSTVLTLYTGTFNASTIAADGCSAPAGLNSSIVTSSLGDRSTYILALQLVGTINYTAVVSTSYAANWGFQFFKTRIISVTTSGYTQPNRAVGTCAVSASANSAYIIVSTQSALGSYILLTPNTIPSYNTFLAVDTYAFAYNGSQSNPPTTCPAANVAVVAIAATSYGNATGVAPLVIPTTYGKPYSAVISNNAGGSLPAITGRTWGVNLFVFFPNETAPATTTTTSGSALTSTTSGTGTTSANATTTNRFTSTTTSDAAAIAVPLLVVAGALLQLLL